MPRRRVGRVGADRVAVVLHRGPPLVALRHLVALRVQGFGGDALEVRGEARVLGQVRLLFQRQLQVPMGDGGSA